MVDKLEPELTNRLAELQWRWLCLRYGEETVRAAIRLIPGRRRAFPLNIARAMRVRLPPADQLDNALKELQDANTKRKRYFDEIREILDE